MHTYYYMYLFSYLYLYFSLYMYTLHLHSFKSRPFQVLAERYEGHELLGRAGCHHPSSCHRPHVILSLGSLSLGSHRQELVLHGKVYMCSSILYRLASCNLVIIVCRGEVPSGFFYNSSDSIVADPGGLENRKPAKGWAWPIAQKSLQQEYAAPKKIARISHNHG